MRIYVYMLLSIALISRLSAQNKFSMSQYMLQHSFVNVAAIGNQETVNAALFHRSQWVGLDGAPTSQGLNVNLPFRAARHTLGLMVMHDKIGATDNSEVSLGYAYKARLSSKTSLLLGLGATLDILKSNYSKLYTNDNTDPSLGKGSNSLLPNFKYGMYLTSGKFYAGIAVPNLLENKIVTNGKGQTKFNVEALHYYLQAGYLFTLSKNTQLGASTLVKEVSGAPLQADLNLQFIFSEKFGVGVSYRTSKDLVGLVNYQITPMFKVGYSYDYGFSNLAKYNSGSHEIMLIFHRVTNKKAIRPLVPRF